MKLTKRFANEWQDNGIDGPRKEKRIQVKIKQKKI